MRVDYVVRRFLVFLVIVWLAATINFFLPRLSGLDPVRQRLLEQAALGGYVHAGIDEMVKEYEQKFGLDRPLWEQYLTYLRDVARFDFNYSIANYPRKVTEIMAEAIPWTIGLLGTTTLLSFSIGTFLGALLAWPRAPAWMRWLMPPLWAFHAIPFFLFGLILMYFLSFQVRLFPMTGGYAAGSFPALTPKFILDVVYHSILPAASMILVGTGGWALAMRGMMVTTLGEDYVIFAEAKGLKSLTVFMRYCVRNAILPQTTGLAIALGNVLSGAVLVEVIFGYPGIGNVLYSAIRQNDHFLIQGIVFSIIVALGVATFVLDVVYPLLDPRITYRRA